MKQFISFAILIILAIYGFSQEVKINHSLQVKINPETTEISVIDTLTLSQNTPRDFLLNAALIPTSKTKGISLKKIENTKANDVGMDRDDNGEENNLDLSRWQIKGDGQILVIAYNGKIESEIEQSKENYQRGFSQTPGIICTKGIYLAGSTYWIPAFKNNLVTFSLTTELPKEWKNVTIGKRINEKTETDKHIDTWSCDKPQEEIFLIAAPFYEYAYDMNNGVKTMAFLRSPDEGLANKYLEVTEQYMNMYNEMLGKYPYSKFALVENFWETGYGMPSFTLLGEKIIRFPFILHSSYPHELLHNWWGNSVYVDFENGNWCEGTTVFMADHLIKEQRGEGEDYRRSTLQKYSNLVNRDNDFPLNKFIGRYDGPSEAIGYGKASMMWQMLRQKLGDEIFLKGMRLFYKDNQFHVASYTDIRKAMETVSGIDLKPFFDQWINRIGAPEIAIQSVHTDLYGGKYRINISLAQIQSDSAFNIDVPINVATDEGLETFVFNMDKKLQSFQIPLNSKPLKLAVDPQYDVFRILNPNEVPPTLSKIWGNKDNIIILPSQAKKEQLTVYQEFASQWKAANNTNFEIVSDKDLIQLPPNKTAWILGYENKFTDQINQQLKEYQSYIGIDSIDFAGNKITKKGNDFVFTLFKKDNVHQQTIFIELDNIKAIPGLITKLPHYGKYSYLGFTGDEPTNISKGQWTVLHSPMVKIFDEKASNLSTIAPRKALGTLKPVFSEKRMMETIKYLSSTELKGRGLGTPEIDKATDYIVEKFKSAGLQPLNGLYRQEFSHSFKDKGILPVTNVIGIIPGTDPNLKESPVVMTAHYDHLGLGWPDVHAGDEGKIHPGADDNASGISILIELATTMAKTIKPKRTIVFIATSAEEAGLIGSRYFVEHRKDFFKNEIFAAINLDTDGSLFDKKLLVLNGNTAKEWKFIFMGTDYTTGIKSEVIEKQLDASDQMAFIEQGIPAVQLLTGATENYHRPTDTYEKIDSKGLVKVATVTKEVVEYLADRIEPMPFTGKTDKTYQQTSTTKTNRRVSTGSVPAFDYSGTGVKIGAIIPGSPAEKSGLKTDDIIIAINDIKTDDLKTYSDVLKKYNPGDTVKITVLRKNVTQTVSVILEAR